MNIQERSDNIMNYKYLSPLLTCEEFSLVTLFSNLHLKLEDSFHFHFSIECNVRMSQAFTSFFCSSALLGQITYFSFSYAFMKFRESQSCMRQFYSLDIMSFKTALSIAPVI
jgi:hypothetical protein